MCGTDVQERERQRVVELFTTVNFPKEEFPSGVNI